MKKNKAKLKRGSIKILTAKDLKKKIGGTSCSPWTWEGCPHQPTSECPVNVTLFKLNKGIIKKPKAGTTKPKTTK